MADSIHDLFDADASDRNLPSPYMEKSFAKFEAQECAKAEERVYACRKAILGQIFFIFFYFVLCFQLMCLYNYYQSNQWSYPYWD